MGLFGESTEELARREIEAKKRYVAKYQGNEVNIDIDDLIETDRINIENKRKRNYQIASAIASLLVMIFFILYFIGNPFSTKGITLSEFNKIQNGMSYQEVVSIIGEEGTVLSSVDLNIGYEYAAQIYSWYGNNSVANANVTFQGGKVIAKAQLGLK